VKSDQNVEGLKMLRVRNATNKYLAVRLVSVGALLLTSFVALGGLSDVGASDTNAESSIGAQFFASQVQTLGQETYPDTFAGTQFETSGVTTVYISANNPSFQNAVNSLDTGGYPVQYVLVNESFNQMSTEMSTVTTGISRLQTDGINPTKLVPDPATGKVDVTLAEPSISDLSALSAGIRGESTSAVISDSVQASNYVSAAQSLLSSLYGTGIFVEPSYGQQWIPAKSRASDTYPWTGGDQIYGPNTCTSGFAVTGNISGNTFVLTAGHCASGFWYTGGGLLIGGTSVGGNYFKDAAGDDFQTILAPNGAYGQVWYGTSSIHPVNAQLIPSPGVDQITFDGARTGEVPDNLVSEINATVVLRNSSGTIIGTIKYQVIAGNTSRIVAQGTDSGGPMYQREPGTSAVAAVAIINSILLNSDGTCGCMTGTGEEISQILSASHSSLIYGS
jgi:hypothetical protein